MERQGASGVAFKNLPVTTRFLLSGLTRSFPRPRPPRHDLLRRLMTDE
jgi:hypothetical protein